MKEDIFTCEAMVATALDMNWEKDLANGCLTECKTSVLEALILPSERSFMVVMFINDDLTIIIAEVEKRKVFVAFANFVEYRVDC